MPPGRPAARRGRGRPRGSTKRQESETPSASDQSEVVELSDDSPEPRRQDRGAPRASDNTEDAAVPEKTIPKDLLTRVLHEFFTKEATRISRDANAAVGKYMDIFVREAIARAAVEKNAGFLEVEDLEKVAPQLLLDL